MPDALPRDIDGLIADAKNFHKVVSANPAEFGVTPAQIALLDTKTNTVETKISEQAEATTAKITKTAERKAAVRDFEAYFRSLRQLVQARLETTDVQRAALNLATGEGDSVNIGEALETAPLLLVEQAGVHEHRVRFYLPSETANSTKKPAGVMGCKIYLKIDGEASTDLKDYRMIAFDSKAPYNFTHEAADAGKTAHYIALWSTADDDHSPQSEVFSIKIT